MNPHLRTTQEITELLEGWLEADFSFRKVGPTAEKLAALQDRFDLRTVCGLASHPAILKAAGADFAIAVVDEAENGAHRRARFTVGY